MRRFYISIVSMRDIVIIPTYNERLNIEELVERIFFTIPNIFVVVVDDNSPDGTADVVRALSNKYQNVSM